MAKSDKLKLFIGTLGSWAAEKVFDMLQSNSTKQLLMQLNQQRSKGYLCDVVIVVENALFRAHKNILAARSNYFQSLVLHDNLISLDAQMVKPLVFRQVLDFIYTGHLPGSQHISKQNLSSLLTAALYLQIGDLAVFCRRRLEQQSLSKSMVYSNGSSFHSPHYSCTPTQVPQNNNYTEEGRFLVQSKPQNESLSEAAVFLKSLNSSLGTRTKTVSTSSFQQSIPELTNHCSHNVAAQSALTLPLYNPTFELSEENVAQQQNCRLTKDFKKRPRGSQTVKMGGNCNVMTKLLVQEHQVVTIPEGLEAPATNINNHENNVHSKSEDEGLNTNKKVNCICYQSQTEIDPGLNGNMYVCISSQRSFPSPDQLEAHEALHGGEGMKTKGFEMTGIIKSEDEYVHPKESGREKQSSEPQLPCYMCSVCSKSFMDMDLLQQHERTHWLIRPFQCKMCGKLFTQRGTMTRHMRSHLALKPFACEKCGMRFTRQYRLREHARLHSDEKPIECPHCGVKFTQKHNLINHLSMHIVPSKECAAAVSQLSQ